MYYNNGDREMGDYSNDEPIGKHIMLKKNGEIEINNLLLFYSIIN